MWINKDITFSLTLDSDFKPIVQRMKDKRVSPGNDGPRYWAVGKTVSCNQQEAR